MATAQAANRNFFDRIQDLLRRKPQFYDVVFCVGPAQKKVKGVRILLEAASSALERKFDFWDSANVRQGQGNGIPIPDFEPDTFEIFVKLTMFDNWTAHSLANLKLQPGQVLNLISICRTYEIEIGLSHLEDLMKSFYRKFANFVKPPDFLRLSYTHLETILGSDNLPLKELDVFKCACKWGKGECQRRGIEGTPENLQLVLGDSVYEIRFPLMTPAEFSQCIDTHNILTDAESLQVFRFFNGNDTRRAQLVAAGFPFKTKSRAGVVQSTVEREVKAKPLTIVPKALSVQTQVMKETTPQFSTLDLTMGSKIVDRPPFICDGTEKENCILTNRKILVHGFGFLGPIDEDASYEVTVRIVYCGSNLTEPIAKRINAQKGNVFRIMFDQPITLPGSSSYWIFYSLKGPNTKSFQRTMGGEVTKRDGENQFWLYWGSNQLAEILYTNA